MSGVTVSVPASSANLGPGFDSFGLALDLRDRFSAEPAEEWSLRVVGEAAAADIQDPGEDVVVRAMRAVFSERGEPRRAARVFRHSRIPVGRGLGSSAAAAIGGALLADSMCEVPMGRDSVFATAAELEGHADNVAAAMYGGFTIAWEHEGSPTCSRFEPPGIAVVMLVAAAASPTALSRGSLPETVRHADAAAGAARAALMATGIALGRRELVAAGAADLLHEPYRGADEAHVREAREALVSAGADGAVLSGSGPSLAGLVVAFSDEAALRRARAVAEAAGKAIGGKGWRPPSVMLMDRTGAVVEGA